jgi:hypothetical protein
MLLLKSLLVLLAFTANYHKYGYKRRRSKAPGYFYTAERYSMPVGIKGKIN